MVNHLNSKIFAKLIKGSENVLKKAPPPLCWVLDETFFSRHVNLPTYQNLLGYLMSNISLIREKSQWINEKEDIGYVYTWAKKSRHCSFLWPSLQVSTCKVALFTVQPLQSSKVITRVMNYSSPCKSYPIDKMLLAFCYFFVKYSRSVCGMSGPTELWAETETAYSISDVRKTTKLPSSDYLYISTLNILVSTLENWIQMWIIAFFIRRPVLTQLWPDLTV